MNIAYIEKEGKKLFSFSRHNFKQFEEGEFIDGGFEHTRFGSIEPKSDSIENLISEIREQFIWGQNFDQNGNKLPQTFYRKLSEMTTSHIQGVLIYFTEKLTDESQMTLEWKGVHLIFLYELKFRYAIKK